MYSNTIFDRTSTGYRLDLRTRSLGNTVNSNELILWIGSTAGHGGISALWFWWAGTGMFKIDAGTWTPSWV